MEQSPKKNDVFDNMPYSEVLEVHVPQGVQSVVVESENTGAPLRIETALAVPEGFEGHDAPYVIVQLPGFPNHLVDEGRTTETITEKVAPNRHLLRTASLARSTGVPVRAFGFPGGPNSDTLSEGMLEQVKAGDYSELVEYYVAHLKQTGVERVAVDGYSLGGAITPDFCLACARAGIEVTDVFWGAVANADLDDGLYALAKRFIGMGKPEDYEGYAAESLALSQEAERHKKIVNGIGAIALQKFVPKTLRTVFQKAWELREPNRFAMGRGIVFGKIRSGPLKDERQSPIAKMQEFMAQSADTKIHIYTGSEDTLAPPETMQALAAALRLSMDAFNGRNHSVRDDLPFMNDYINSRLSK